MPDDKVGRLETLLARVQRRAAEPRRVPTSQVSPKATTGAMAATPMATPMASPPATPISAPIATPVAAPVASVAARGANGGAPAHHPSEPPANQHPTSPPLSFPSEPPAAAGPSTIPPVTTVDSDDSEVDVEVSTEVVDIDVDVDVDDMGMPLESGAQPVADHVGDTSAEDAILETTMADAQLPVLGAEHEVHSEAQPEAKPLANEIEEPAPSSSPRPIAAEKPETFEDESAPRHTPPPESGKQVAAAPSTPPSRKTSAPPPSLEGHTLIGGWREPGLGGPIVGAPGGPGVRVPAPGAGAPPAAQAKAEIPPEPVTGTRASAPPRHSDRPLSPEVTRAELAGADAKVASFEGAAPAFKPSTFGDLLDASLGL